MKFNTFSKIFENRMLILEGIKNNIFKTEAVEEIAKERNEICLLCVNYDKKGTKCDVIGTQPCCGHCGCSLTIKQRSLASNCPINLWETVLSEAENKQHNLLKPKDDNK